MPQSFQDARHWVRRSDRQPLKLQIDRQQQILDYQEGVLSGKCDGLQVRTFPSKGRGIVTTRPFSRGDFVCEYGGELIEVKVARRRDTELEKENDLRCFMFYFKYLDRLWCVDATIETGNLGRLVNHSRDNHNVVPQIVEVNNQPHLVLIADRKIDTDTEIVYDYGDRRAAAMEANPWLKRNELLSSALSEQCNVTPLVTPFVQNSGNYDDSIIASQTGEQQPSDSEEHEVIEVDIRNGRVVCCSPGGTVIRRMDTTEVSNCLHKSFSCSESVIF
jgi:[histone H4]-lysine20 N-methyltransferase SETD8